MRISKSAFIKEVKPLFKKHLKPKDSFDQSIIESFDDMVHEVLPDTDMQEIYATVKTSSKTSMAYLEVMTRLELFYSYKRWFRKRLLERIKA
jgi:hypothetical protein